MSQNYTSWYARMRPSDAIDAEWHIPNKEEKNWFAELIRDNLGDSMNALSEIMEKIEEIDKVGAGLLCAKYIFMLRSCVIGLTVVGKDSSQEEYNHSRL